MSNVRAVMEYLRQRAAYLREHQRIHEWVDSYLERCEEQGSPVVLLTQLCVAKEVQRRFLADGGRFSMTRGERDLFHHTIPEIVDMFAKRGFQVDWYLTLNLPYHEPGRDRITPEMETAFRAFIEECARPISCLSVWDWEREMLGGRPALLPCFLENPWAFINRDHVEKRIRLSISVAPPEEQEAKEAEQREWMLYRIGCEIEEGRWLMSGESPLGQEFLIATLAPAEKLRFYGSVAPTFNQRIVDVLPHNPWLK